MRRLIAVAALALAYGPAAGPALPETPTPVAINITADFTAFWDATKTLAMDERVAAFHRDMDPKFPGFYDPARFAKPGEPDRQDKRIAAAIAEFPKIRERYEAKVEAFDADLAKNTATFVKAFEAKYGPPSSYGPLAYEAANIVLEAIKKVGKADRAAVRDAVRATRDHRGILGIPITFDDKGDVAGGVIYFYQVKGPGFEQVKAITVK